MSKIEDINQDLDAKAEELNQLEVEQQKALQTHVNEAWKIMNPILTKSSVVIRFIKRKIVTVHNPMMDHNPDPSVVSFATYKTDGMLIYDNAVIEDIYEDRNYRVGTSREGHEVWLLTDNTYMVCEVKEYNERGYPFTKRDILHRDYSLKEVIYWILAHEGDPYQIIDQIQQAYITAIKEKPKKIQQLKSKAEAIELTRRKLFEESE